MRARAERRNGFEILRAILVALIASIAAAVPAHAEAILWTTDENGIAKTDFAPNETVYVHGSGFAFPGDVDVPVICPDGSIVVGDGSDSCPGGLTECWDTVTVEFDGSIEYQYILTDQSGQYTIETYASPWDGPASGDGLMATTEFTLVPPPQFEAFHNLLVMNQWSGTTIQQTNSSYGECDSIPFRIRQEVPAGVPITVIIKYDFSDCSTARFFDSIRSVDDSETGLDPFADLTCGSTGTVMIPTDATLPPGAQTPGDFSLCNIVPGSVSFGAYMLETCSGGKQVKTIAMTFTPTGNVGDPDVDIAIAYGLHLAAESIHGVGNGANDFPGASPQAAINFDGASSDQNISINPNAITAEPEACCFDDGSCQFIVEADCNSAGGTPQGNGTTCDPNICPQPNGACCLCDGMCLDVTEAECLANPQFVSFTAGMDCTQVDCDAFPTCVIGGSTLVCPETADIDYSITNPQVGATYDWTITGNGLFDDGTMAATGTDVVVDAGAGCNGSFTLNVTCTLGNCVSMCELVVTVDDDIDPVPPAPPAAAGFQCVGDVPAPGDLTATDNCSGDITVTGVDTDNGGAGCAADPLIITRTWTFVDDCGNDAVITQTITVIDSTDPVPPAPPAAAGFQCVGDVPAPGALTATDNCSGDITVTGVDTDDGGAGCAADPLVITRTWTFVDDCGNDAVITQTITVIDDTDPLPPAPPAAAGFQCVGDVPAPGDLTATDNCAGDITVTGVDTDNGGAGCAADPLIITRTWTFVDACGNDVSNSQTITVIDDTDPLPPAPPAAAGFQCVGDVPAPGALTATDNCSGDITVTGVDTDDGGAAAADPLVITRTWTFVDACGNDAVITQTITVIDDTDPLPPAPPAAAGFQCVGDVPAPGDMTAMDNCSGDITVTGVDTDNGGAGCAADPLIITRTWTFVDACGNDVSNSQTITVIDDTDPLPPAPPADAGFQCVGDVPAPGDLTATDNCSGNITVTGVDTDNGGAGCAADPLIITRTWTFVDACGNDAVITQTITVIDDTDPVPPAPPAAAGFQCVGDVPAPGDLTATDNCSGDITVTGVDTDNGGAGCPGDALIITRTWTFVDDCLNDAVITQTITVVDDTDPVPPAPPAAAGFQCVGDVPAPGDLTATDNCSPDITVTGVDTDDGGAGCAADPLVITRTWTFVDDCLNDAVITQTITVVDDTDPVPPAPPAAAGFQCVGDVPAPGDLTATDNCSGDITVTGVDTDNGGAGCAADPLIITRTWTFVDDCGNDAVITQTITVIDSTDPVPPAPPAAAGFQCVGDVPAPGDLTATDNCSGDITATGVDTDNGGAGCAADPLVITRTWTFVDDCGNDAVITQTITVIDDTDPLPPAPPAAAGFQCVGDVPAPGDLTATDNCSGNITVTGVDTDNGGAGCAADPLVITRTWTFVDACGNDAVITQAITVIDNTNPMITCPMEVTVECAADVPPVDLTAPVVSDNCTPDGDIVITHVGDTDLTGACGGFIERTYRATDACGNFADCTQIITVDDTTNPTIDCPADVTVECVGDVPAVDVTAPVVSDNCTPDGDIVITHEGDSDLTNPCGGFIERTYRATDACGNSMDCVQIITVDDTTNPMIDCPPDVMVQCEADVPAIDLDSVTATDNCTPDGDIVITHEGDTGLTSPCGGFIERTYRAKDACGNIMDCTQVITVNDTIPPQITCPPDLELACGEPIPPVDLGEVGATDNCSLPADIDIILVDETIAGAGCDVAVTRTFRATDACGNSSECIQTITIERDHPGWNWVNNGISLTGNEPTYWSAHTGMPKGVSPFEILDPGVLPGRPANDGTGDRVLRGYVLAWAVNNDGDEIRWNHLKGEGTIVNYRDQRAWEYNTYNHGIVMGLPNGTATGTPGVLNLDGVEYAPSFEELLLNFQATGSGGFSGPPGSGIVVTSDTDLTLHPVSADLRQSNDGPVTTKASFDVWNENEVKFSGTHRCITCWDQELLSRYDAPNHFPRAFLQTDHGKARIDGVAADFCDVPDDPDTPQDESVTSIDTPLLGVAARHLSINTTAFAASGTNLIGMGFDDTAVIQYDPSGGAPPESQMPQGPLDMLDWAAALGGFRVDAPDDGDDGRTPGEPQGAEGPIEQDRVSGTEKGSLVIFPKIELRWDAQGNLVQDTFLSLSNDYPDAVLVKMYFINGDPPIIVP